MNPPQHRSTGLNRELRDRLRQSAPDGVDLLGTALL